MKYWQVEEKEKNHKYQKQIKYGTPPSKINKRKREKKTHLVKEMNSKMQGKQEQKHSEVNFLIENIVKRTVTLPDLFST